jgi:SHS2 domain-containing protein
MKNSGYKFLDHTADVQVHSWGETIEDAFAQTAYSLMVTITPDLGKISPETEKTLKIKAEDKEALLFDFLSELLYIFDVDGLVFSDIRVFSIQKINENYILKAKLKGERFDIQKHEIGTEVKAITYSYMSIEEKGDKVKINIVFDI